MAYTVVMIMMVPTTVCATTPGSYTVEPGITVPTFSQPLTMNIYASNGATPPEPGALIATLTQTFQIPYRPPSDVVHCGGTPWYSAANGGTCYNGLANLVTFDFTSLGIQLPDQIMASVQFNTSTSGYHPLGTSTACYSSPAGCPYDSLNVSADNGVPGVVAIGTPIDPDGIYASYVTSGAPYACTGSPAQTHPGSFLLDTGAGCWTANHPEILVDAAFTPPGGYQLNYTTHIQSGFDGDFVNITNDGSSAVGATSATSPSGNLCVGVYFFDPNEELQSCCACEVTPNGLVSLSVKQNNANNLTSEFPDSEVVKLLAWSAPSTSSTTGPPGAPILPTPGANVCNAAAPGTFAMGLKAWGTTLHAVPVAAGSFALTENKFSPGNLSFFEMNRLTTFCSYNQFTGSGNYGQCKGCQAGGLGAAAKQ